MKKLSFIVFTFLSIVIAQGQNKVIINVDASAPTSKIHKEIYGQFAEHLGRCIYDGIWVGKDSEIPNINGYRKDVVEALKALNIPVLRWPGGCFADTYHWKDGIGPKEQRPKIKNVFWGGTMEDNSFGTHEFFELCEMLGCEPYLSANVGSGSVKEMTEWLEYITSSEDTPMVQLRKENGREDPWHLKYIGIGNESWGCGGDMTPEYYADLYRQYSGYCRLYSAENPYRIACGANAWDARWTDVVMSKGHRMMEGISVHYYTIAGKGWGDKGPGRDFEENLYFSGLKKGLMMDSLIKKHVAVMDKIDPKKRIGLLVDEWGIWTDPEVGSIPGHLFQQNTMRDALIASTTLDIFHRHTNRVVMANIAQVVNVLQAMILTKDDVMVLTPTYHVFNMYKGHQDAEFIPISFNCPSYKFGDDEIPSLSCTLSKNKDNKFNFTISNLNPKDNQLVEIPLNSLNTKKIISGNILTSEKFNDYNSFEKTDLVKPGIFKDANLKKGVLNLKIPPMSIVNVEME
ncbi:MAG: alpha-N-arabinofuranosidase [Marinilabiliaceae bacterium]|nr:alpha-N-arabinofuranosidase [Marinilabiliaceae bacterium]